MRSRLVPVLISALTLSSASCERSHKWLARKGLLAPPHLVEKIGSPSAGPAVEWTMIDVTEGEKQADAHLLTFPDGTRILVDTGFSGAKVLPYLKKNGISHLDAIVITHTHLDHYGGLAPILDAGIGVDQVYFHSPDRDVCEGEKISPSGCREADIEAVLGRLKRANVPVKTPVRGSDLYRSADGAIRLTVLASYSGKDSPTGGQGGVNDTSTLLLLQNGTGPNATRAFLAGDLNGPLGGYLAQHEPDLHADVLKAPHHGTEGCAPNSFFDRVSPRLVLVPAPRGLWESERSRRIREYFSNHGIPVRVSGIDGDVTVRLSPRSTKPSAP